ncbi:MAG TPA: alpha/beta hydrolase [Acidimicrobiales bacterium]|nr:alpha/beta hydrolase [Acidimicrobiales bacterium]
MTLTQPTPLSRFARSGSVRIHYVDSVNGDGGGMARDERPPVVFVPGLTDLAEDYLAVLPEFGRRTIVIDLRGRGASESPGSGSYGFGHHVGDVEAVVADAGVGRFHLATFSRGTAYGLGFAFAHPDQVLTVSIGDYHAREIGIPGEWPDAFVQGRWRGQAVLERISEVALHGVARESVERPFWDELGALGKPVLVMRSGQVGRQGHEFVDAAALARYRKAVPDVEIHTFEDSGHDLFRPDPTRYPRLVADFIIRHEPGTSGAGAQ